MKAFFEQCIQKQIDEDRRRSKEHGWDFKERTIAKHIIGDLIRAVLEIDNPDNALKFYNGYLEYLNDLPEEDKSNDYTMEQIAKANIGWCFGEGMAQNRIQMWNEVTLATHPFFGTITPTPHEAFKAGVEAGTKIADNS
jgi:hypothetical protein